MSGNYWKLFKIIDYSVILFLAPTPRKEIKIQWLQSCFTVTQTVYCSKTSCRKLRNLSRRYCWLLSQATQYAMDSVCRDFLIYTVPTCFQILHNRLSAMKIIVLIKYITVIFSISMGSCALDNPKPNRTNCELSGGHGQHNSGSGPEAANPCLLSCHHFFF